VPGSSSERRVIAAGPTGRAVAETKRRGKRRDDKGGKSGQRADARERASWVVEPSPLHGRGVFAARKIEADEVVHVAPVLLFSDEEYDHLAETLLVDYVFEWHEGGVALALGVGGLFNHDADANCRYELSDDDDPARPAHVYVAERTIKRGEELTINYGDEYAEWHGWI
jgi:SET domain-containing protein